VASPLSGKRLLVVAENAELAELVAEAAVRLGAEVEVRASGRAAVEALAARPPDLAVLDLPLPDLSGADVLSALGQAGVPAIGVSGVHRGPGAAEEARRLGAVDFFEKPFPIDGLMATAARLLGAIPPGAAGDVTEALPLAEIVDDTADAEPVAEAQLVDDEDVLGEAEPLEPPGSPAILAASASPAPFGAPAPSPPPSPPLRGGEGDEGGWRLRPGPARHARSARERRAASALDAGAPG
jgi:CheY-like chemotaxis protein